MPAQNSTQFMMALNNNSKRFLYLTAFILVTIIFQFAYGLQTLWPGNINWLMQVKHDWGQHYLGFLFLKNESWHFPLGHIANLFYPLGTNVGFTDSIPVLALVFKLIAPLFGDDFQYFGMWLYACHLLASYFTIKLLRLFHVNAISILIAVVFIAANPVLIYQGMHPALCAHWMLLASIYYYLLPTDNITAKSVLKKQLRLMLFAAIINPYIWLMVMGFSMALFCKFLFINKSIKPAKAIAQLVEATVVLFILWYVIGMIDFKKNEDLNLSDGFGLGSMNLNSLWNPNGLSSYFKPSDWVRPDQYEGFMYLGAGMILLSLIVTVWYAFLFVFKKQDEAGVKAKAKLFTKSMIPFYLLLILFALFAVSHIVTYNKDVLFTIPLPALVLKFGDVFRASGRFFWPVYYILFVFVITAAAKTGWKQIFISSLLGVALLLQLVDTKILFSYRNLQHGTYKTGMSDAQWKQLFESNEEIVMYPPFQTNYATPMDYQFFCYMAATLNKPITTGYVARYNGKEVLAFSDSLNKELNRAELPENRLYITTKEYLKDFAVVIQSDKCNYTVLDQYIIITARRNKTLASVKSNNGALLTQINKTIGARTEFELTTTPAPGGTLRYSIDHFYNDYNFIFMSGFCLIENTKNNRFDSSYIILSSPNGTYRAKTTVFERTDITDFFKGEDLKSAGYKNHLFTNNVPKGMYNLGFMVITKDGNRIMQLTDQTVRVKLSEFARVFEATGIAKPDSIRFNVEGITKLDTASTLLKGWAFFPDQNAEYNTIQLVLHNDVGIFNIETDPVMRSEIASYFNSSKNWTRSGFTARIQNKSIPKGNYKLGIEITDTQTGRKGYVFTGQMIQF